MICTSTSRHDFVRSAPKASSPTPSATHSPAVPGCHCSSMTAASRWIPIPSSDRSVRWPSIARTRSSQALTRARQLGDHRHADRKLQDLRHQPAYLTGRDARQACALYPGGRRSDEVPLPRRSGRFSQRHPQFFQQNVLLRLPDGEDFRRSPSIRGQRTLPPCGFVAKVPCRAGSPSRRQRQIAPPPGSSMLYRSLPKAGSAINQKRVRHPCQPRSSARVMDHNQSAGNPCRLISIEIRSK